MISKGRLGEIRAWAKTIAYTRSQDLRAVFEELEILRRVAEAAEASLILDVAEKGGTKALIEDTRKIQRLEKEIAAWRATE